MNEKEIDTMLNDEEYRKQVEQDQEAIIEGDTT